MIVYDNMIIPVFTTDKEGVILYKNKAAVRCIPSPRTKGNINNYLNNRLKDYRISKDKVKLEFIRNSESIFNRALVYCQVHQDIWCFLPELQLSEPEDMSELFCGVMIKTADACMELLDRGVSQRPDFAFLRYQRIYTELLTAMKRVNVQNNSMHFNTLDVLDSIKKRTEELCGKYSLRIGLDITFTDPEGVYRINFKSFASVYLHILRFVLKSSSKQVCNVEISRGGEELIFEVSSELDNITEKLPHIIGLETLCRLFPDEAANILFLQTCFDLYGYAYSIDIKENRLSLKVCIPLDKQKPTALHQSLSASIIASRFLRAEKRISEYMDSVFIQI
ncbi:MAG: hypothetical protein IKT46_03700 [Clostridia bacterium]|nr:hypothetical protein [Clostridia bacterium]